MSNICPYINLHTHLLTQEQGVITVYNRLLHETDGIPAFPFSAGLHPWYADQFSSESLSRLLDKCSTSNNLVAFGESGLDKACNIPMQLQQDILELHFKKAEEYQKPIILHCVKAWEELINISSKYKVMKILHGYNGSTELTKLLTNNQFNFSIGKAILNPRSKILDSIHHIPMHAVFCETDESDISIEVIYNAVSEARNMNVEDLKETIYNNYLKLGRT